MSRRGLYVLIGVLLAVVIGMGAYVYQEQQKPALEVRVDSEGLTIDGNRSD